MTELKTSQTYSTGRLFALALALSIVMAIELAAGNGFLTPLVSGAIPFASNVLLVLMVIASTGAIIGAFTSTLKPQPTRIAGTAAICGIALLSGVEASHVVSKFPLLTYFNISFVGQLVVTYSLSFLFCNKLRIQSVGSKNVPVVSTVIMAAFGLIMYAAQSWISLERAVVQFSLVRNVLLVFTPAFYLVYFAINKGVRLDKKSFLESLKLRLPELKDRHERQAWQFIATGTMMSMVISGIFHAWSGENVLGHGWTPFEVFNIGLFGLIYLQFFELRLFTDEQKHGFVSARISPISAQRFLKRHHSEKNAWAATAGLKTSNYLIDHDPGASLHKNLPASIMQLRSDEIQRCVTDVLGPLSLHNHVVGHRVLGVIDPEHSVRSCVDTLKMFSALYLDATPLIERRIKGLISLLPIIDAGLAQMLRNKDVDALIRRNLWFFHFNFTWIDQHVIHTPRSTRYDVRMATLSSRIRHTMFEHLEKTGGVGNFVWIGTEARDRILHEAPTLKNVIETCPIPSAKDNDELLMFTIKFEQLIPRLQRYFDLDTMRRTIMDFEPSQESLKLLNLMNLQFSKTKSADEILDVLTSITSVPWRGFKEKDQALQLILKAHLALNDVLNNGQNICSESSGRFHSETHLLLKAVQTIGYPSQILHNAQIDKISLRDFETMIKVASNQYHPRFHESWMLLSTNDYHRLGDENVKKVLDLIMQVAAERKITKHRVVQSKAVDAVVNIARATRGELMSQVETCMALIAKWYAEEQVDSDICCLFLDAHTYISDLLGKSVPLPPKTLDLLDQYFQELQATLGTNHPRIIAILSRWQIFRNNRSQVQGAA